MNERPRWLLAAGAWACLSAAAAPGPAWPRPDAGTPVALARAAADSLARAAQDSLAQARADSLARALADSARVARWREDLRALRDSLPARHVDLFWRTPRARFEAVLDSLEGILHVTPDPLIVAGLTLAAAIADAHTGVEWNGDMPGFQDLPLFLQPFEEGWFVAAADSTHARLLGARLLAVDGTPVAEALARLRPFVPHENDAWFEDQAPLALASSALLAAAGVARDAAAATWTFEDSLGARFEARIAPLPAGRRRVWRTYLQAAGVPPVAASQRQHENYWARWMPESRTLFVRYNRCADVDTFPFRAFAESLLALADSARAERLVVDLRRNGGGNSTVIRPLIQGVRERRWLNRRGRLFVLIGRRTFSSAMMNALEFRARTRALLVGTPTGGRPNSHGEVRRFTLPHSRLDVTYSTRFWKLTRRDDPWVEPDVTVPVRWADYRIGRDAALEAVLGEPPVSTR
uniref:Tail specific protease domain-containing protein n=1 Tax=Eiseniibacteriota bacterium TaxID=2212470 RepID=A0A832I046_UNCEI